MRKIFNKFENHKANLLIILFCGIVASLPFFSSKLIVGSDFFFNQARIKSTVNALKDGQILPQVDPNAFGGFGHSWNLFYGPLPTYLASFLRIFTGNLDSAINLLSIILIIASGFSAYFSALTITNKKKIAFFVAIFYMLASPIILTDFRSNNQSRMLVTALMPLVFDGLFRIFYRKKHGVAILSLASAGIILSHMLSTIIVAIPALVFVVINHKKSFSKEIFPNLLKSAILILGFSAFFILPFLETQNLKIYNISNAEFKQAAMSMNAKVAKDSSFSVGELLFRNQEFPISGIFIQLWLLIGGASIFFISRKNQPKNLQKINATLWVLLAIFFLLCSNIVPWGKMPAFLYTLQYPSRRFMPIISLISSFIAGTSLYYFLRKKGENSPQIIRLTSIILVAISFNLLAPAIAFYSREKYSSEKPNYSLVNLEDKSEIPHEKAVSTIEPLAVSHGEYLPTALAEAGNRNPNSNRFYSYTIASSNFLIERGNQPISQNPQVLKFENFHKNGSKMNFEVKNSSKNAENIELPAIFYPGFEAKLNDVKIPARNSKNGLLEIEIPAGASGEIKVKYGLSKFSAIGLFTTISTVIFAIFSLRKSNKLRQF